MAVFASVFTAFVLALWVVAIRLAVKDNKERSEYLYMHIAEETSGIRVKHDSEIADVLKQIAEYREMNDEAMGRLNEKIDELLRQSEAMDAKFNDLSSRVDRIEAEASEVKSDVTSKKRKKK